MSTRKSEMWGYSGTGWRATTDITGYKVEAMDGSIGKIDRATNDTNASYVVVDTGPWILGRKVLLPAGVIDHVDPDEEKVYVHRTKDQIKNAPEFDVNRFDQRYRDELNTYYGPGGRGYRERRVR